MLTHPSRPKSAPAPCPRRLPAQRTPALRPRSTERRPIVGRLLAVLALAGGLSACGPPPKDPALEGYERFLGAVRTGNAPEVWHRLTPASQKALALRVGDPGPTARPADEATAQLAGMAGRLGLGVEVGTREPLLAVLGVRPGWQFELDLPQSAALETSTLSDDRRVVVGPLGGARWRIPMLRVEGDWRVDLFAATPASP